MPFDAALGDGHERWRRAGGLNPLSAEAQRGPSRPMPVPRSSWPLPKRSKGRLCASAGHHVFLAVQRGRRGFIRAARRPCAAAAAAHPLFAPLGEVDAHAAAVLAPPRHDAAARCTAGEGHRRHWRCCVLQAVRPAWAYTAIASARRNSNSRWKGSTRAARQPGHLRAGSLLENRRAARDALLRMSTGCARADGGGRHARRNSPNTTDPRREPPPTASANWQRPAHPARLLLRWLELGCERPPFVVIACERQVDRDRGHRRVQQIDRIDRLRGGALAGIGLQRPGRGRTWPTGPPIAPPNRSCRSTHDRHPAGGLARGNAKQPGGGGGLRCCVLDEPKFAGIGAAGRPDRRRRGPGREGWARAVCRMRASRLNGGARPLALQHRRRRPRSEGAGPYASADEKALRNW